MESKEQRRERNRRYAQSAKSQKKYNQSTKGKAAQRRYFQSAKGKAALSRGAKIFFKSEKGKSYLAKYRKSEKFQQSKAKWEKSTAGKASLKKYAQSEKGKVAQKKYLQSEKGKAIFKAATKRYFASEKGKLVKKESNKKWHEIVRKDPVLRARQLESIKRYYKTPQGKLTAAAVKSRRRKGQKVAEPSWNKRKLVKQIFAMRNKLRNRTGNDYEIDHVIPIKGKTVEGGRVSGLHVWYNLIPIKKLSNIKKHDRMPPQKQLDKLPEPDKWMDYLKYKFEL
jgi:hypothetical protein